MRFSNSKSKVKKLNYENTFKIKMKKIYFIIFAFAACFNPIQAYSSQNMSIVIPDKSSATDEHTSIEKSLLDESSATDEYTTIEKSLLDESSATDKYTIIAKSLLDESSATDEYTTIEKSLLEMLFVTSNATTMTYKTKSLTFKEASKFGETLNEFSVNDKFTATQIRKTKIPDLTIVSVTSYDKRTINPTATSFVNSAESNLNSNSLIVHCNFSFPKVYDPNDNYMVCKACQNELNFTNNQFQSCKTLKGSTIVNFDLVVSSSNVDSVLNNIENRVKSGNMKIIIKSSEYVANISSFSYALYLEPTLLNKEPTPLNEEDSNDGLSDADIVIIVVCVLIGALGIINIGVLTYIGHKDKLKKRSVSPCDSATTIEPKENK
ncbi:uncharacterized protein LOC136077659 [Hydra vulgaris]|uniref:Uncharacterized protein LOC136077659 n=1 Tax=Hydra vulgaris TaxID=6087 RepID=A0ABM4BG58_HYDVU